MLGKDILFKFISPLIPKEIYSLNNVTIIKEIDKERICRTKRHLSSLKTNLSPTNQLTLVRTNSDVEMSLFHETKNVQKTEENVREGFGGNCITG